MAISAIMFSLGKAQNQGISANYNWQLGLHIKSPLHRKVPLNLLTTDPNRISIPIANPALFTGRTVNTISINNQSITYYPDFINRKTAAINPSLWYRVKLVGYYRFPNGFSISTALAYGERRYTTGVESLNNLPHLNDAFYKNTIVNREGGLQFAFEYYLWNNRRFQLYSGLFASFIIDQLRIEDAITFVVLSEDFEEVLPPQNPVPRRTSRNTELNLRLGALYRLTPEWSIGIETIGLPLSNSYRPNLGVEIRYWWP